jgi:hypothetical protein
LSLHDEVQHILDNFDSTSSDDILKILIQIQPHLKSDLTQTYLKGKIHGISGISDNNEKKKLCKNLKPYLDWYIQGK